MRVEVIKSNVPDLPVLLADGGSGSACMRECGVHIHDEIEILLSLNGSLLVCADGKSVRLIKGDAVIINRRVPHSTRQLEPYTIEGMLQFRIEKLQSREFEHMNRYLSLLISSDDEPMIFIGKNEPAAAEIAELMGRMFDENKKKEANYEIFIRGYMELLLGTLYRNNILRDASEAYNDEAVKKVWPVIEYIDKNYEKPLALEDLSKILNMNKQYFCRVFKRATKNTPTEYINFVRVWKAENLLTTTDESVLEISMTVGFSSVSYFNRIFKKLKKTTPTAYRSIVYAKNKMM